MGILSSSAASAVPAAAVATDGGVATPNLAASNAGSSHTSGSMPSKATAGASQAAGNADVMAATVDAKTASPNTCTAAGRHKRHLQQLEAKLNRHMDCEDRRVKELTEGVLYDLLPAALDVMLPSSEDPLQELHAERCRAVAAAALAVSSLMNAPPGFLEFLLCIPWRQLPLLYPAVSSSAEQQDPEQLLAHLAVDEQERKLLVNMPIHPKLVRPVLEFMYRPEHSASVPPLLQPQALAGSQASSGKQQCTADAALLEAAEALLDGATALHCAAIRGNPAGVHHLLQCGADPTLLTAAGETALESVPVCGCVNMQTGRRQCICLSAGEQEVWECRSRLARTLIAKRCLSSFHVGLRHYLRLAWLCLLGFLGLLVASKSLQRPALQVHVQRLREQRQQAAQARACALLSCMRQEASQGSSHLSWAKHKTGYRQHAAEPPQRSTTSSGHMGDRSTGSGIVSAVGHGMQSSISIIRTSTHGQPAPSLAVQAAKDYFDAAVEQEPLAPATPSAAAEAVDTHRIGSGQQVGNNRIIHEQGTAAEPTQPGASGPHEQQLGLVHTIVDQNNPTGSASSSHEQQPAAMPTAPSPMQIEVEHQPERATAASSGDASVELAFKCYVKAVHALQSLTLRSKGAARPAVDGSNVANAAHAVASLPAVPVGPTAVAATVPSQGAGATGESPPSGSKQQQLLVPEDEQAELYCSWAESVLLKSQLCGCPGCTALAVQAIRMAHIAVARLYGQMQQQQPQRWRAVGHFLSRVVYAHIALLCQTEAHTSPSKNSLWRAQQCLQEWDRLAALGVLQSPESAAGTQDPADNTRLVDVLRSWARTAESDLIIAEALLGSSLAPLTTVNEALAAAFVTADQSSAEPAAEPAAESAAGLVQSSSSFSCLPVLARPVTAALLDQLQVARGLATCPSPPVKALAAQVVDMAARELAAAAKLKLLLANRSALNCIEGVTALTQAIAAAEPFCSLSFEVTAARVLQQQCCQKAAAAAKLQDVLKQVVQSTSKVSSSSSSADADAAARGSKQGCPDATLPIEGFEFGRWEQCISMLESAVDEAKDARVNVVKARRLIKELQAQLSAAEAAALLQSCMTRRPCGSGALRAAVAKAEAAAAGVSGAAASFAANSSSNSGANSSNSTPSSASGCAVFSDLLVQLVQAAKKRLELERASEALHKAVMVHRNLADLPKLEAAILSARKVGAEDLCPDDYKAASELRVRLTTAARVKQQLDAALKALATVAAADPVGKAEQQQEHLVEPVESAIQEAERWSDLLPGEAARAADALAAWRTSSVCEAKLTRALRDGIGSAQLSRLITDAAAAGVKVAVARKVLKLQQLLEQAMAGASDASSVSSTARSQLAARLEAAEQGGVASVTLEPARQLLGKLAALEAQNALEAALKPHSDWSATARMMALQAALAQAEDVLGVSVAELAVEPAPQQWAQQVSYSEVAAERVDNEELQGAAACNVAAAPQAHQHRVEHAVTASSLASDAAVVAQAGIRATTRNAFQRTDSVASSSTTSDVSTTSAATGSSHVLTRDAHGPYLDPCSSIEGSSDVIAGVRELALRAWHLLQQDQRVVDEINKQRAEQERARRELKESYVRCMQRERQERSRVEAERIERSRAEREKQAAERKQARAKTAAERSKNLAALWGSAQATAHQTAKPVSTAGDSKGVNGAVSSSTKANGRTSAAGHRPATAPSRDAAASTAVTAAVGSVSNSIRGPANGAGVGQLPLEGAHDQSEQSQQQQLQQDADTLFFGYGGPSKPQHARTDSYELLGDVSNKLGREVLALLDMNDHHVAADEPVSDQLLTQQHQLAVRGRLSMDGVPLWQHKPAGRGSATGLGWQRASASWQGSLSSAAISEQQAPAPHQHSSGSGGSGGSHPLTPRFGLVDLGGASWGVDKPAGSTCHLSRLSLTRPAAAAGGPDKLQQQAQGPLGRASSSSTDPGVWGSALGLAMPADVPALPPLAPKAGPLARYSYGGAPQRLTSDQAGNSCSSTSCLSPGPGVQFGMVSDAGLLHLKQQHRQHQQQMGLMELPVSGASSHLSAALVSAPGMQQMGMGGFHSYTDYSSAAGDLAILSQAALNMQLRHHGAGLQMAALGSVAGPMVPGPAAGHTGLGDGLGSYGISSTLALQYQQAHALQQQQQQLLHSQRLQQQQVLLHGAQQRAQVGPVLDRSGARSPILPSASTAASSVGQYSSSSAFGIPHLSAFSADSVGAARGQNRAAALDVGSTAATRMTAEAVRGADGNDDVVDDPSVEFIRNLPEDLSFSPPSQGPAGRLLGGDVQL